MAQYLDMRLSFRSVEGAVSVTKCRTLVKTCDGVTGSDWNTLVMFRCPIPEPTMSQILSLEPGSDARQRLELSIESSPSRGSVFFPVCVWDQPPATPSFPADAAFKTAAVCVRPFRPYFFGTTTPSVTKEQVGHHRGRKIPIDPRTESNMQR